MAIEPSRFRYGTSNWSESSWTGVFNPPGTRPTDEFAFFATRFSTVEADNTYYSAPSWSQVRGWRQNTPEGFLVSAKFPRSIVHCGEAEHPDASKLLLLDDVGKDLDPFLEAMRELGPRAGPLVIH